jgi:phosphoglycerate dehydrogenase-like enzyme
MRAVRILVPDSLADELLGTLPPEVELIRIGDGPIPPEASDARMALLAGVLTRRLDEILAAAPDLEVLQTVSAGVDWLVDRVPDGVTLCNAGGVHDTPVAEWVVTAILTMTRRFPDLIDLQREGIWDRGINTFVGGGAQDSPLWPIPNLEGGRVLVLGHGSIGRAVERRLAPFGVTVTGVARHPRPGVHALSEAHALAGEADVVVVLLPLTAETKGVVDGAFLDAMRPGALLVNAARGRHVVDGRPHPAVALRARAGGARRHGSRAAAPRSSALDLSRPAHHAPHRRYDGRLGGRCVAPRRRPDPALRGGRTAGQCAGRGILTATHEVWVARLSGVPGVDNFAADGGPRALREHRQPRSLPA